MTTVINPDDYCKNPQDYKNVPEIDNTTRAYWDDYCKLKKQAASTKLPDRNSFAEATSEAISEFIIALISPMNIALIGAMTGMPMLYKTAKSAVGYITKNGLSDETIKAAEEFIAKGGDAYATNAGSIMFDFMKYQDYAAIDVAEEAGYYAGRFSVIGMLEGVGELASAFMSVVDPVLMVMLVLQITGMIFDAWDPCNLNSMLTADTLKLFSDQFNKIFRENMLVSVDSTVDSYGHVSMNTQWPIEYFADTTLVPYKADYYNRVQQTLMLKYLSSLTVNSDGDPIFVVPGKGRAINNNDIKKALSGLELSAFKFLGNNNTVVENFLIKYWPAILGVIIFLIILFLFLRRKKSQV